MEGENAVDDGIDGLAVVEGIGDEPEVARGRGGVEAELGDWRKGSTEGTARTGGSWGAYIRG